MSQTATVRDYFNDLVTLVRSRHMSPSKLDEDKVWQYFKDIPELGPDHLEKIRHATTATLQTLNHHSLYWKGYTHDAKGKPYAPVPEGRIEDGDIAYMWLPECLERSEHSRYAQAGFDISTRLKAQNLAGAIIDLRNNYGGGCDPMLAAIAPFLDKENFVGWATEQEVVTSGLTWDHHLGIGRVGDFHRKSFDPLPCDPNTTLPVAVIYGNRTCSAGEVVALSLKGGPLSKSFGQSTAGYTTANVGFPVPYADILGASDHTIIISLSSMTDRHHHAFNDIRIKPDVKCNNPLERAIEWIRAFPR